MAETDPQFNDWAFSNAGLTINRLSKRQSVQARPANAIAIDGGVSSEMLYGHGQIQMGGVIIGDDAADAQDKLGELQKRLRGGAGVRRGRLELDSSAGHYYGQLSGDLNAVWLPGDGKIQVDMTFLLDDPFLRTNISSVSFTPSGGGPTASVTFNSHFSGDCPRIPLVLNAGPGWSQGDLLRMHNTTTGERFELVINATLASSVDLIIDSENHEVREGNNVGAQVQSGQFPYLRGGVTNTFDFTGTDFTGNQFSFVFWDRSFG